MMAPGYDVATVLWQGARPYQEDTLLADFHGGMDRGFAILADGMGGHAAGDLASRLVVIDAASHLKFLMHDGEALEHSLATELKSAIETANEVLHDRAADDRRLQGMGTTFLATVIFENRLYWASVGDSPLYLWREGRLRQLNEDHSMAPVIDQMAKAGEITAQEAVNHPDRNALTSVLMGRAIKVMDVPKTAMVLDPGDVLIQASDGLQYIENEEIARIVGAGGNSREIADALMSALRELNDPNQDNTAILVLQFASKITDVSVIASNGAASASERAVGTAAPQRERGPTPQDVARPPGARRWLVPGGLLASAAVAAGVMFGLPSLQKNAQFAETTTLSTLEAPAAAALEIAAAEPLVPVAPIPTPAASVGAGFGSSAGAVGVTTIGAPTASPAVTPSAISMGALTALTTTAPFEVPDKWAHPRPASASAAIVFEQAPIAAPVIGDVNIPTAITGTPQPTVPPVPAPPSQRERSRDNTLIKRVFNPAFFAKKTPSYER